MGHQHVTDKRSDDLSKGGADNDSDGEVNHIATAHNNSFELFEHSLLLVETVRSSACERRHPACSFTGRVAKAGSRQDACAPMPTLMMHYWSRHARFQQNGL
jgi:hypothetical protein